MDAADFIDFAGKMAAPNNSVPAQYRSAVSRAYYGCFHLAKELLGELRFHCKNRENEHQYVQRHFQNCKEEVAKSLGGTLSDLHEYRKQADYQLADMDAETHNFATTCLIMAHEIRSKLQTCRNSATLATVTKEMLQYRKDARIQ